MIWCIRPCRFCVRTESRTEGDDEWNAACGSAVESRWPGIMEKTPFEEQATDYAQVPKRQSAHLPGMSLWPRLSPFVSAPRLVQSLMDTKTLGSLWGPPCVDMSDAHN
jgi:hypothetical protein